MKTLKQHISEGYKQGKYGAGNVGQDQSKCPHARRNDPAH